MILATMRFERVDIAVLVVYMLAMLVVGLCFARKQHNSQEFFLAGRNMPWMPVAMSMYASMTSAMTFMGIPAAAYSGNIGLLIVCAVSPLLVPVLVLGIYPVYRRLGVTTTYEYIGMKHGVTARATASLLFLLARLGWLGIVIYAPAKALEIATGIDLTLGIVLIGILATLYTVSGGLKAVLWTDVAQFIILVGGAVWMAVALAKGIDGGVIGTFRSAAESGHLKAFSWRISLTDSSAWVVFICFFLTLLQDYGTDQIGVQRMLAVRSRKGMTKAAIFNAGTDVVMIALLVFLGTGMFVFYKQCPEALDAGVSGPAILPYFVVTQLPAGVAGLVIAAIFAAAMSSVDSGLNSLVTVIENDFIAGVFKCRNTERKVVSRARLLTMLLGAIAICSAFYATHVENIVEAFLSIVSLFNAPVLGLFILTLFWRKTNFRAWLVGLIITVPATLALQYWKPVATKLGLPNRWCIDIDGNYYVPFAFALICLITIVGSILVPKRERTEP